MRALLVGWACLVEVTTAVPWDPKDAGRSKKRRLSHAGEVRRVARLWAEVPEARHPSSAATSLLADTEGGATLQPEGDAMPASFSWSNASGVDYLTPVRNQHIPRYCGSCWAYAATSTLADRWNIASVRKNGRMPHLQLATQHLVSCAAEVGTCGGGDDLAVYDYASEHGIPHESCSAYMAQDMTCRTEIGITDGNRPPCYNCDEHSNCFAVPKYHKLFARSGSAHRVGGAAAMRREIHANGPVSCGIVATDKMEKRYEGGVFAETLDNDSRINHVVELVGWGTDEHNNQYWLARNSWGYEWGEGGFFRIVTSENSGHLGTGNNLIEEECAFALPDRFEVE